MRPEGIDRQGNGGVGRVRVLGQESRAVRHQVQVTVLQDVSCECAHVGNIEHRAVAHVALDAERVAVQSRVWATLSSPYTVPLGSR